jgi:hypothetical protein
MMNDELRIYDTTWTTDWADTTDLH